MVIFDAIVMNKANKYSVFSATIVLTFHMTQGRSRLGRRGAARPLAAIIQVGENVHFGIEIRLPITEAVNREEHPQDIDFKIKALPQSELPIPEPHCPENAQ